MSAQDTAAILLLARHLDVEEPSPGQSKWTDIKAAIDGEAGWTYERFADNVRYSIHLTGPTTGVTLTRWDFHFSDVDPVLPPGAKNRRRRRRSTSW